MIVKSVSVEVPEDVDIFNDEKADVSIKIEFDWRTCRHRR